jgi:hypothetical protein
MRRWIAALLLCLCCAPAAFAVDYLAAASDLPLADGLKEQTEKSTVFDTPMGRIVNAYATGATTAEKVYEFYDATLPQLGWEKQSSGSYRRAHDTLKIDVWGPDAGPVNVSFTLSSETE